MLRTSKGLQKDPKRAMIDTRTGTLFQVRLDAGNIRKDAPKIASDGQRGG